VEAFEEHYFACAACATVIQRVAAYVHTTQAAAGSSQIRRGRNIRARPGSPQVFHLPLSDGPRFRIIVVAVSRKAIGIAAIAASPAWLTPRTTCMGRGPSLREFQPDEVARLEAAMWRSSTRMNGCTCSAAAALLRRQYELPPLRAYVASHRGGAVVFRPARRGDYDRLCRPAGLLMRSGA
jgi:hypothetical protein